MKNDYIKGKTMIKNVLVVSLFFIFACILSANEIEKSSNVITDKARLIMKNSTKNLYSELMKFKDDKKFHNVGFMEGYKYRKWLVKLDKTKEAWHKLSMSAPIGERLDDKNMNLSTSIYYLRLIATSYMRKQGKNDKFAKDKLPNIKKVLEIK